MEEWEARLVGKSWDICQGLKALQIAEIPQLTKHHLFMNTLNREFEKFLHGTSDDSRFFTIGYALSGIAMLDEVDIEHRLLLINRFLQIEALTWHGIAALGDLKGFPDASDDRRKSLLFAYAKGKNSWHRVYAIEAMASLEVPLEELAQELRFNILYPEMHQEVTKAAMLLLDKGMQPLLVLEYVLPVAHPDHPDWRMAKVAFLEIGQEVSKRCFVNYTLDVQSVSVNEDGLSSPRSLNQKSTRSEERDNL